MKRVLDPSDLDEVTAILAETESRAFAETRVSELIDESTEALDSAGISASQKDSLIESSKLIAG
jgi:hypothetical protein